jgi:Ni/Co efflux regulator RcnB
MASYHQKDAEMKKQSKPALLATAVLAAFALLAVPAYADKPSWAGGGKPESRGNQGGGKSAGQDAQSGGSYFGDRQQVVVRDYYAQEFRGGKCPPGLAKKNNGCMPPGQAKKWNRGRPLPGDVVYYDLPPQLVVRLGQPPAGHKYVRVASDILLIAVGTSMVVDAITDLGRM